MLRYRRRAQSSLARSTAGLAAVRARSPCEVLAGTESVAYGDEYVRTYPECEDSVRSGGVVIVRVRLDWARFGDFRGAEGVVAEVNLGG